MQKPHKTFVAKRRKYIFVAMLKLMLLVAFVAFANQGRTIVGEKILEIAKLMEDNRQKGAVYPELEKKVFSEDPAFNNLVAKREKLDKEIAAERKK